MKKRIVKTTLAVAVVAASVAIGYASYTQYQNNQLAYANPLMEENIEAMSDGPSQCITLHYCKSPGGGTKGTTMYICAEGTTLWGTTPPSNPKVNPCSTMGIPKIKIFSTEPNNGQCYTK
jgi:hypothetical protein